jgi:hypothetical protein
MRGSAHQRTGAGNTKRILDMTPKKILAGVGVAIAVIAIAIIAVKALDKNQSSDAKAFEAPIPPVEFLYLDGARILDFLAELEGGEVGAVHRISKEIASVNAGGSGGGFTVGASSQHESVAESTVTRTEASGLGILLNDLARNESHGISFHSIDLTDPRDLESTKTIREGMLVRFVTHELLSPGYIRPYVVVRQSATLAALFPQASGNPIGAERAEEQRRKAESFAHQVGPDPRITFVVSPHPKDAGDISMKVLMPMHYRDLTQERSLLEKGRDQFTGGRLVVFGKVIRVFRRKHGNRPDYTDFATREIWRNPLEQASNFLIGNVSHNCKTPRIQAQTKASRSNSPSIEGRACFLAKLKRQTTLHAPGAVILPIAIYK